MKYTQKCVVCSLHFTLSLPSTVTLKAFRPYCSTNTFTIAGPKVPLQRRLCHKLPFSTSRTMIS